MIKSWTEEAGEDFEYWTKQDKKTLKPILQLLKDIDRNRYEGFREYLEYKQLLVKFYLLRRSDIYVMCNLKYDF